MHRWLLSIALALVVGCSKEKGGDVAGGVVWRPDAIRVSVSPNGYPGSNRPYVQLDQTLPKGTEGWTMSKFELPTDWGGITAAMEAQRVVATVPGDEQFRIDAMNFGTLGFALLENGRSDEAIRNEWRRHAAIRRAK